MKTKNLIYFFVILINVTFYSCVKHEIIPPPISKTELKTYFSGKINNTDIEYTQDVEGFKGVTTQSQHILPTPQQSKTIYYFELNSSNTKTSIKVGISSLSWDAGVSAKPSLSQFNTFFTSLLSPATIDYNSYPENGFNVEYTDALGNVWTSDPESVNPQSVSFTKIENESDSEGDYSKFIVHFSCYVYRNISATEKDSILIENAVFQGWFMR